MEATAAKLVSRDRITDAAATLFSADSGVHQIPETFIRTDELQAAGVVVAGDDEAFELPVVDMAKLIDQELSASETAKLGSACRDWGFFQVSGSEMGFCFFRLIVSHHPANCYLLTRYI
jgi:hypothetical protein